MLGAKHDIYVFRNMQYMADRKSIASLSFQVISYQAASYISDPMFPNISNIHITLFTMYSSNAVHQLYSHEIAISTRRVSLHNAAPNHRTRKPDTGNRNHLQNTSLLPNQTIACCAFPTLLLKFRLNSCLNAPSVTITTIIRPTLPHTFQK